MAWTLTAVLGIAIPDCTTRPACSSIRAGTWVIGYALFALINATHGMEFWHTTSLVGLVLCDLARAHFYCGDLLALNLAIIFVLFVHAFCHFQSLLDRHAFLETDYLHVSRERLEYDFKRLEAGLIRLESRLPAVDFKPAGGSVDPTSDSSDSTSTATGQEARSTQSAPSAMEGRERRHSPEDVHRHSLPPTSVRHEVCGCRSAKDPEQRRRAPEAMLMECRDSRRRGHIFRPFVDGAECAQKDAPAPS